LEVSGKPLLVHTLEKFLNLEWNDILVSIPQNWIKRTEDLLSEHFPGNRIQLVEGGQTRTQSVWNCLKALKKADQKGVVCIHDGVRPLVSPELIKNSLISAKKYGSAIPTINPVDTVRMGQESETSPINRDQVFLIQTPQSYHLDRIIEAYEKKEGDSFTDDSGIYERRFGRVQLINGEVKNIKITTTIDLEIADFLLKD
jgi:2-C-methyl-D-erythritol 4-phosphate cytidylyltransferase